MSILCQLHQIHIGTLCEFFRPNLNESLCNRFPQVCLMGKYHNILYIGLRTCWDWGVRDSEVVVQLLGKSNASRSKLKAAAQLNNLIYVHMYAVRHTQYVHSEKLH